MFADMFKTTQDRQAFWNKAAGIAAKVIFAVFAFIIIVGTHELNKTSQWYQKGRR